MADNSTIDIWDDIIPKVIKIPWMAYKHRHLLQNWWKKLVVFSGNGDTNVVVTGRSAVGKSFLTSHLHGESTDLSWELPEEPSQDVETKAIQIGDWAKVVRVIPGQSYQERFKGLQEAFSEHENLEGVIHVVDWGYTQIRDETIVQKMIDEDGINTIPKIRKFNLKDELFEYKNICLRIKESYSNREVPKWLVVAVNKADLFTHKINDAQKYYHPNIKSKFTEITKDLIEHIGKNNIKCISVPVCSWEKDFAWNQKRVKTNIGGMERKKALFRNFVDELARVSSN